MSTTVRTVIALTFGALTILISLAQYGGLVAARRKGRGYSFVPFIGAILGVTACLLAPWQGSRWLLPLVFVLDPTPIMFLWVLVRPSRPTKSS